MTRMRLFVALVFLLAAGVSRPVAAQDAAAQHDREAPDWLTFEEAIDAAQESGKKVMVFVYAPWCGYCQKMIKQVYPRADVQSSMGRHYEFARLNGTITSDTLHYRGHALSSAQLAQGLGMRGYPTHVFLSSAGEYIAHQPGYLPADAFIQLLEYVGQDAFEQQTFKEFAGSR